MQCAVGEHFDFIKLLNFYFILLVLCKYFDFIPTYVLFCMRPLLPPYLFVQTVWTFFYLLDFREHYDNIVSGQHLPTPV